MLLRTYELKHQGYSRESNLPKATCWVERLAIMILNADEEVIVLPTDKENASYLLKSNDYYRKIDYQGLKPFTRNRKVISLGKFKKQQPIVM